MLRTFCFIIFLVLIWGSHAIYEDIVQPAVATELAVQSVNGTSMDAAAVRVNHGMSDLSFFPVVLTIAAVVVCYAKPVSRFFYGVAANPAR